jgi:pimeloyl-ACP methyl ester carboxylesterase
MLTGEYDYLTPPEEGKRTASNIKGAEFIEMKGIGHFPMSENYPVFKGYLQQALQRIEQRAKVGQASGQASGQTSPQKK